jgi:DinB family protein
MTSADLLADAFGRIRETVREVAGALAPDQLTFRIETDANPVGWLIWHLTRVQDDHVAAAFGVPQVWVTGKWAARFGLPEETMETGYGHSSSQVAAVTGAVSSADLLIDYHEATYQQTLKHVSGITDAGLDRIVDRSWDPPVTLGVRLISVIDDDMQHAGQAAFIRGCMPRQARS